MNNEKLPQGVVLCYDVLEPNDKQEDRGGSTPRGRFIDLAEAKKMGKGRGCMGGDVQPRSVTCIVIDGIAYPVDLYGGNPVCTSARDALLATLPAGQRELLS